MNPAKHSALLSESCTLVLCRTSDGGTAWRATEHDAPTLYALITSGTSAPLAPETAAMTFAVYREGAEKPLGEYSITGRSGLNEFYLNNVGFEPDNEPNGIRPILEFVDNVAAHLLLRYFVGEAIVGSGSGTA